MDLDFSCLNFMIRFMKDLRLLTAYIHSLDTSANDRDWSEILFNASPAQPNPANNLVFSVTDLECKIKLNHIKRFYVTKTCLYNFDPLKPHFYIVKLGFTGV